MVTDGIQRFLLAQKLQLPIISIFCCYDWHFEKLQLARLL